MGAGGDGVAQALTASAGGADENDASGNRLVVNALTSSPPLGPDDNDAQGGRLVEAYGTRENPDVAFTLAATGRGTGDGHGQVHNTTYVEERTLGREVAAALTASGGHHGHSSPRGDGQDNLVADVVVDGWDDEFENEGYTDPVSQTLASRDYKGPWNYYNGSLGSCQVVKSVVRRLTPLEYERLQGFPDGWTEFGVKAAEQARLVAARQNHEDVEVAVERIADSHRYKMMGNAVAVPVVEWVARRIAAVDELMRADPEAWAADYEDDEVSA